MQPPPTIALPPQVPLQAAFAPVVRDACATLQQGAGALLHSLYLYGSVARGEARPGASDLDLTLVLQRTPTPADSAQLERLRQALQQRHAAVVSKVDFDIGTLAQVLAPAQRCSWGYWLKHHCRCLAGTDLAARFDALAPSRGIALAVNAGYGAALRCASLHSASLRQPTTRPGAACKNKQRAGCCAPRMCCVPRATRTGLPRWPSMPRIAPPTTPRWPRAWHFFWPRPTRRMPRPAPLCRSCCTWWTGWSACSRRTDAAPQSRLSHRTAPGFSVAFGGRSALFAIRTRAARADAVCTKDRFHLCCTGCGVHATASTGRPDFA